MPARTDTGDDGAPRRWSRPTREWWQTWARSPIATLFAPTDWQRLRLLVPIVEAIYAGYAEGRVPKDLVAELRLQEAELGATVSSRQRLGIKLTDEEPQGRQRPEPSRTREDPRLRIVPGA